MEINQKIDECYLILSNLDFNVCTIGLLDGLAGVLLFVYEYEKKNPFCNFKFTNRILNCILEKLHIEYYDCSYSNGISGVNIVIKSILTDNLFDIQTGKQLKVLTKKIDKSCFLFLESQPLSEYSDFLHGELGIIWSIISHSDYKKHKQFQKYLRNFVVSTSIDDNGYFYSPSSIAGHEKAISMGLSHGVPAALIILSNSLKFGKWGSSVVTKIKKFLDLSKNNRGNCLFPSLIFDENKQEYSRMGWCYGDLGVAIAFWQAGKQVSNDKWKSESVEILIKSSKRKNLIENSIEDAGFCHGTAGIAHIYNRMYRETNNPLFKGTANYWIKETLKMVCHTDGLAGYKSKDGVNDYFFLEGISGIGLVLLSHLNSDEDPTWDKCFLLS